MNEKLNKSINNIPDKITLKELIQKIGRWWSYLKTQWVKITIAGLIGGSIGFIYAWMEPVTYKAKITFVVEEGKSGGSSLGGLALLAGQFGVDMGGSTGSGVLSGDNILLYFKSESLAKEVLLSKYDSTSNKSVADVYTEVYKLKEAWKENEKIGVVNFPVFTKDFKYSRLQDSLLSQIISDITKKQFSIAKTDKKASFIDVTTTMVDEDLAKNYCDKIVEKAVENYITIKTMRQKATIDKLQIRVDSIANLLNKKTVSGASLQTTSNTMDINPLYRSGTAVAVETTVRDKTMLATIFASVTQNLEMAKFTLSQETPVIQIIDSSDFPLKREKVSKAISFILFFMLFASLFIFFLVGRKLLKSL